MLDDADMFLQLCKKREVIAEPEIIEAIKTSCATGELILSKISIVASLCEVIAQVLSSSSTIKLVDLNDCMLRPKGLSCIFKAVSEGSSISSLYLKGNNISGSLVEQLGDLLVKNNTLKVLHIEWNILGSQVDVFKKFCNGLAINHYLKELDLRYNQINTHCADSLAAALRTNKSLTVVDLAWNSLGMSGGQKILQAVLQNRNLISLNLKGNCIPSEISSAIEDHIIKNKQRQILSEGNIPLKENIQPLSLSSEEEDSGPRIKCKTRKKKKKRERSRTPLEELRDTPLGGNSRNDEFDNNASEFKKTSRNVSNESDREVDLNEKIDGLNKILQERSLNIDHLKTELDLRNTEIDTLKNENEKLKNVVENLKQENKNILEEKFKEIEYLKKVHLKEESNWKESYRELEEIHINDVRLKQEADTKIRTYDKELRKAYLELQSKKEKLSSTVQSYEDTISENKMEVHRIKREMQEKENRCKIEVNTLKETLKETTDALEKCQEQLQKLRNELRESLETQAKLKIKTDECERYVLRTTKIEDALHKTKEDKEKLEEKLQDSRRTVASLQQQIMKIQEESIEPQKRYEGLKIELQLEKEISLNLKAEIKEERARIKEQNDQLQKMLSQINGLHTQLNEMQTSHAEAIRLKNTELDKMKILIAEKTRELDEFKSEQIQKAHKFQTAVNKYLDSFAIN